MSLSVVFHHFEIFTNIIVNISLTQWLHIPQNKSELYQHMKIGAAHSLQVLKIQMLENLKKSQTTTGIMETSGKFLYHKISSSWVKSKNSSLKRELRLNY